jgi:predicted deacylase
MKVTKKSESKIERLDYPIKTLPNGDTQNLRVFPMRGTGPGPKVYIQANVHGAEVQGNAVIFELMNFFSNHEFKGSITFVPMANPQALIHKSGTFTQGRFNPQSGKNWNRNYTDITECSHFNLSEFVNENNESENVVNNFKEYLYLSLEKEKENLSKRGLSEDKSPNLILQELAAPADIILDLHTGPKATRYLYAAEYAKDKVKDLPFPFTLLIPNEYAGAMDEACFIPWVKLKEFYEKQGTDFKIPIESYTIELGSEEIISMSEAKGDAARILHLFSQRGIVQEKDLEGIFLPKTEQRVAILSDYKTYYAPKGALVEYIAAPGDFVAKDQLLYRLLNFSNLHHEDDLSECLQEVLAQEDCYVINHCPSAVINKGTPLYQVMANTFTF